MLERGWSLLITLALLVSASPAFGQVISSSIVGTVVDPARAVVPSAEVLLTNESTGAATATHSNEVGLFRFPTVLPGRYSITVKAPGFKTYTETGIALSASETRDLGSIALELGALGDQVTVTAEATPVQTASSEKAALISGTQLQRLALRGRDFLAMMALLPGVVDTTSRRETTDPTAIGGIYIQGARANQKNYTVDGVFALDTGSNATVHYEPNMDTIAEVKVLTSNYQAEYGRTAGGTITVITRSGGREFHGTGYWSHRHEGLNANEFFRNKSGTAKPPYRYNIAGYSIGGPIYVPKWFNTSKDKLFFFFSQEYVRQRKDYGTRYKNMPTELERTGDFSRSFDTSGKLIIAKDPTLGQPFPGNVIPPSRINNIGRAMLNFHPLPNYTDPDPALQYQRNYKVAVSGSYPKRDDVVRIDANPGRGLHLYYRFVKDTDRQDVPFGSWVHPIDYFLTYVGFGQPGKGHVAHVTKTFTPTLVNEFSYGKSYNYLWYDAVEPARIARSAMGNPREWYPLDESKGNQKDYIPDVQFGSIPVNAPNTRLYGIPYKNWNDIYSFVDNLSKVWGNHNIKTGIYVERTGKYSQELSLNYRGAFYFNPDANNPNDSGHGFANALLGNFQRYSEATDRLNGDVWFWNVEWYAQDNWRVTRRLTLDIGLRFYHMTPAACRNYTLAGFDPASYSLDKAPRLYVPGTDAKGKRVAVDPATGNIAPVPLIGLYVPDSGDPANGMRVGGKGGYPRGVYELPGVSLGPRFGFAYDLFGNGKTALRGGLGTFYNRVQGNPYFRMVGNPPLTYTPTTYYGNLDTFAQTAGARGPSNIQFMYGKSKPETTMNFSLGVQQNVGFSTVLDVSYVGSLGRHLLWQRDLNAIPMFARFAPANADPTNPATALPDNFLRPYRGWDSLRYNEFAATSNYNSLQVSAQRRFTRNLMFGVAYTWSRTLGVAADDTSSITSYFSPREREYGPLSYDRSHVLIVNYVYDLPKLGERLGGKYLGAVLDGWNVSGITSFTTGAPFTPGWGTNYTVDTTGSSEGARITVVGDPHLPKDQRSFYRNFRTEAFAPTPVGSFGNAGVGILRQPGINNWDISLAKRIPTGLGERRSLQFRAEFYNAWNHTQFASYDTSARFDRQGKQINANFGAYSSARDPRIIAFSLRFEF